MRFSLAACGALAAVAISAPAYAVDYTPGNPADVFSVTPVGGTLQTAPTISGSIKRNGLGVGEFTDRFLFTIPQNGTGSGGLQTQTSLPLGDPTDLDFLSITFNNGQQVFNVPFESSFGGTQENAALSNIPIISGLQNILTVVYRSRGNGSYSGTLTFRAAPSVPEPATWALFLAGFGVLGFALRRKSKDGVRVRYAF